LPDYEFRDPVLLETALTHRSTGGRNNERLEFLGDAVLGFLITEILYRTYPDQPEGVLTRLRANLVKRETLARLAREIDLGGSIRLGPGEKKSGGWRRDSILANTLESIIGAIYLDAGMEACRKFTTNLYSRSLRELDTDKPGKDPKTVLQEMLQAKRLPLPVYTVIGEQGKAHDRVFTVACEVSGLVSPVVASGSSKRLAEQLAAREALRLLEIP